MLESFNIRTTLVDPFLNFSFSEDEDFSANRHRPSQRYHHQQQQQQQQRHRDDDEDEEMEEVVSRFDQPSTSMPMQDADVNDPRLRRLQAARAKAR